MFIAHFPAALLSATILRRQFSKTQLSAPAFLIGSVAPDLDMIRFYLIDNRQIHHHHYFTHTPLLWVLVLFAGILLRQRLGRMVSAFACGALLHLALDSVTGAINWGWPFTASGTPLVTVPATHDWWVLSFVTHWTFQLEILICLAAYWAWRVRGRPPNPIKKKTPAKGRG